MTPVQAQQWAYEALLELAQGGHALAGGLLVKLLTAGDERARKALAEVAAGRWAAAVELLEALVMSHDEAAPGEDCGFS